MEAAVEVELRSLNEATIFEEHMPFLGVKMVEVIIEAGATGE